MDFVEIHNKYFARLAFFADRILDSENQGEDIASESLVKLWQRFDDFNNEMAIKKFLYTVVRNACLDSIKGKSRRKKREDGFYYLTDNIEQDVLFLMMEAELFAEVTNGIEKLPKAERNIFRLLFFQQMDVKKVAQSLGLSVKTVWNQRARAVNRLKNNFKGHMVS